MYFGGWAQKKDYEEWVGEDPSGQRGVGDAYAFDVDAVDAMLEWLKESEVKGDLDVPDTLTLIGDPSRCRYVSICLQSESDNSSVTTERLHL
jgi:hypothetical protein